MFTHNSFLLQSFRIELAVTLSIAFFHSFEKSSAWCSFVNYQLGILLRDTFYLYLFISRFFHGIVFFSISIQNFLCPIFLILSLFPSRFAFYPLFPSPFLNPPKRLIYTCFRECIWHYCKYSYSLVYWFSTHSMFFLSWPGSNHLTTGRDGEGSASKRAFDRPK